MYSDDKKVQSIVRNFTYLPFKIYINTLKSVYMSTTIIYIVVILELLSTLYKAVLLPLTLEKKADIFTYDININITFSW